ncbi:CHAT domain-containing protein [Streptomyces sp. NEAU-NA10]|uniref:CHAT domain-containing protein n=1 Tax=Streptomyces sp. NEAU-NA10 TaxID=3416050 RepID=UPI003CC54A96
MSAGDRPARQWIERAEVLALRESARWKEISPAAQEALDALLAEEDLDAQGFRMRVAAFRRAHQDAWDVLMDFLDERERAHRHVPDSATVPGGAYDRDTADRTPQAPPALPDDGADEDERHLNLCLTWPLSREVVGPHWQLGTGGRYELRVDIGQPAPDSLLRDADRPFPEEALAHDVDGGDWLQVTVLSEDFAVPVGWYALFLPPDRPSWVCACVPDGPHGCRPQHRDRHLRIPVTAPLVPTHDARLRVLVSHRGNQLQSATVTARVGEREEPGTGATTARVDFTLTAGFDGLEELPDRDTAIRISRGVDGSVMVDIGGGHQPVSTFWLTEAQVEGALFRARSVLTDVHAAPDPLAADARRVDRLDGGNGKEYQEFEDDLWRLAAVGWDLLHLLAPVPAQRAALRGALSAPAAIQVCRQEGQPLQFPWALVYDIPIDAGGERRVCRTGVRQALRGDGSLRSCQDEASHRLNSLCPYGFWGYRHTIEQPPSRRGGGRLARFAGRRAAEPELTVGRSLSLHPELASQHLTSLRGRFGDERIHDCDSREALRHELSRGRSDCIYFYCHGRRAKDASGATGWTELEIGHEDRVAPTQISAWAADDWGNWAQTSPLVFLNGCHTADDTPSTWLGFVDLFCDLDASGVVGTEISVSQRFANEVADLFWGHFLVGTDVGTALHRVRMELLRKGNLLGLAYTAYCSAELRLNSVGR